MVNAALLACLIGVVCPSNLGIATVVPDIGAAGYDFVVEIAGPTVLQGYSAPVGTTITHALPDGRRIDISILRVRADAQGHCSPRLRVLADVSVSVPSMPLEPCSRASIAICADLAIVGEVGQELSLSITPIPDTMLVTSDAPNAAEVEQMLLSAAAPIAGRLAVAIPIDGLGTLAAVRPRGAPPLIVTPYQLGFQWILQIAAPRQATCLPSSVLLQGSGFTVVLTPEVIQELASVRLASGELPARMNESGLVDPNGPIRVSGVRTSLEPGVFVLEWQGQRPDGRRTVITWRLALVPAIAELGLDLQQVAVDGQMICRPTDRPAIRPIEEMFRNIAPGPRPLLSGPLQRSRLIAGEITPQGIMVAGRA